MQRSILIERIMEAVYLSRPVRDQLVRRLEQAPDQEVEQLWQQRLCYLACTFEALAKPEYSVHSEEFVRISREYEDIDDPIAEITRRRLPMAAHDLDWPEKVGWLAGNGDAMLALVGSANWIVMQPTCEASDHARWIASTSEVLIESSAAMGPSMHTRGHSIAQRHLAIAAFGNLAALMLFEHQYPNLNARAIALAEHIGDRWLSNPHDATAWIALAGHRVCAPFIGDRSLEILVGSALSVQNNDDAPQTLLSSSLFSGLAPITKGTMLHGIASAWCVMEARGPEPASRLLEGFLGLDAHHPVTPEVIRAVLIDGQCARLDLRTRANLLDTLAAAWCSTRGRGHEAASRLLEVVLGFDAHLPPSAQAIRTVLTDGPGANLDVRTKSNLIYTLAEAWRFTDGRGHEAASRLIERYLGFDAYSVITPQHVRDVLDDAPCADMDLHTKAHMIETLAAAWGLTDRRGGVAAYRLLEGFLHLDGQPMPGGYRTVLDSQPFASLHHSARAILLCTLAESWNFTDGRGPEPASQLLEGFLGFDAHPTITMQSVHAVLSAEPCAQLHYLTRANLIYVLATAWRCTSRRGNAAVSRLLEGFLGFDSERTVTPEHIRTALNARHFEMLPLRPQANLIYTLSAVWRTERKRGNEAASRLLESFLGFDAYPRITSPIVRSVVNDKPFAMLDVLTQSNLFCDLAAAWLFTPGRGSGAAQTIIEEFVGGVPYDLPVWPPSHLCELPVRDWLTLIKTWTDATSMLPQCRSQVALTIRRVVSCMEGHLYRRDRTVQATRELAFSCHDLWVAFRHASLQLAAGELRTSEDQSLDIREPLLWSEKLENVSLLKHLLEPDSRFNAETISDVLRDGGSSTWPFRYVDQTTIENTCVPERDPARGHPYGPDKIAYDSDAAESTDAYQDAPRHDGPRDLIAAREAVLDRLQISSSLEDMLCPGEVWLRWMPGNGGRIGWWASTRRFGHSAVKVIAGGQSPPGAGLRLLEALLRFDLSIELTSLVGREGMRSNEHGLPQKVGQLLHAHGESGVLADAVSRMATLLRAPRMELDGDDNHHSDLNALRGMMGDCRLWALLPILGQAASVLLDDVCCATNIRPEHEWMRDVVAEALDVLSQPIATYAGESVDDWCTWRRMRLDAAMDRFLELCNEELDLRSLFQAGEKAGLDWSQIDIITQGEEVMTTLPVALMRFGPGGSPVYDHVASVSDTVSLTLRSYGASIRQPVTSKRLLSAHWLSRLDWQRMPGLAHLHARLRQLLPRWTVEGLGDAGDLVASVGNVSVALSDQETPRSVAVIGGHGDRQRGGTRLKGGVWHGQGAVLDGVDLLVLLACSVGRVSRESARDAEGLYADLAGRGAKTVVAARWPIEDQRSADFVIELLRQYDANLNDPNLAAHPAMRARAMNAARRKLLKNPREGDRFTVAAFTLYGAG